MDIQTWVAFGWNTDLHELADMTAINVIGSICWLARPTLLCSVLSVQPFTAATFVHPACDRHNQLNAYWLPVDAAYFLPLLDQIDARL